jgi:hypothetical protein
VSCKLSDYMYLRVQGVPEQTAVFKRLGSSYQSLPRASINAVSGGACKATPCKFKYRPS